MSAQELLRYINLFREKAELGKLVIFVGAGVSRNVEGMPSWNELIQKWLKQSTIRSASLVGVRARPVKKTAH